MNKVIPFLAFSILLLVPVSQNVFGPIAIPNLLEARIGANESPAEGEGLLPLGANYDLVLTKVTIGTSSTRPSVGQSDYQFPGLPSDVVNGQSFTVDRFFDVFFEITIQDVDPVNDGLSVDKFERVLTVISSDTCVADLLKPNFGCLGQMQKVVLPSLGIDLGVDIDGDGELDIITFNSKDALLDNLGPEFIEDDMVAGQSEWSPWGDGNVNPDFSLPLIGSITISEQIFYNPPAIGGEIIPIEATSLILVGAQSFSWMIPVLVSGIGIGLFVFRKSKNSYLN